MQFYRFNRRVKHPSAPEMTDALPQNFLEWFHRFENSIDGSDSWFETSGSGHTEYKECEGDPVLVWKKAGYSRVLDLLMVMMIYLLPLVWWYYLLWQCHLNYERCDTHYVFQRKYPNPSLTIPIEPAIRLEKEVIRIEWDHVTNGKSVAVYCKDGSTFHGDRTVVTVSLGVLKERAQQIFAPPLPKQKLDAINVTILTLP